MIYPYESIRAVHLEITDRCNAACPMCARYVDGEEAAFIQNTQLYLNDIKNIFPIDFIKQLNRINFCGNYGDPLAAKDLLPVIDYFKTHNESIRIEINTNGSARTVAWWKALADLMGATEYAGGVWFGLDGVGETNALYRRNTKWNIIMRNAKAYIKAGGIAHWNFIAFKHNEHQIPIAQALATKMGFKHFNIKLTDRFRREVSFPVIVKGEHLYDLEPPKEKDHQRPPAVNRQQPRHVKHPTNAMMGAAKIIEKYRKEQDISSSPKPIVPKPDIVCVAQQQSSIYVSAQGIVYPCCWIGGGHRQSEQDIIMDEDNINPIKRSIKDIVQGEEFQMVEDSWGIGSIRKCVHVCSVISSDKIQHGPDLVIHRRANEE